MRILHLVHQYPPEHVGGTELYTQSLARELHRRGHNIGVFFRRNDSGQGLIQTDEDGVRLYAARDGEMAADRRFLATFGSSALQNAWAEALNDFDPDLIHVQHLMGLPTSLLATISDRSLPLVVTLHDYWWLCANAQLFTNYDHTTCLGPDRYANCARCAMARANNAMLWPVAPILPLILAWRTRLLRQWLALASELIASMDFVRDLYVDHGIDPDQINVIPLGVDIQAESVKPVQDGIPRFVYIGGIVHQKGVHVVLEAFRQLQGKAELWIVGDETVDPVYTQQVHGLESTGVRFLGKLPHAEIGKLLSEADMLLMPSLWYETFGLVIYEAFAVGLPVMASDLGVMADAVRDGENGKLVAPGDVAAWRAAMQGIVDEPAHLAAYRHNIRRPLTVLEHAERVETLYAKIVGR